MEKDAISSNPARTIGNGPTKVLPVSKSKMVFCFFLIATVLAVFGFIYLRSEAAQIQKIKFGELQTIGKMKVDQILRWRKSRSDDSRRIADSPAVIKLLGEWLQDPSRVTHEEDLVGRLQLEKELGIYSQAFLVDVDRNILLSAFPKPVKTEVDCRGAIDEALVSDKPVFGPLYRVSSGEIHIDIATAIRDVANRPLAVLVLVTNANKFLFPIIEFWPTASLSGETLLARREGDQVLFLSKLKYGKGMTLNLRFPLSTTHLPAAQAVLGRTGVFHGRDYSGKEVIADLRSVPGTDWYLVTKESESEIWEEIRFHAVTISIIIIMLILCIAGGMVFWYQHLWARERERTEKRVKDSEARYRRLFEAAKDGILILDAGTGMIVDVNPYLVEKLGYSREQFLGKRVWEIGFLKDVFANQENFLKLQREKYVRYEDLPLETADGRKIDVEFISNVYQVDHHEVIQCNIRDITERKEAEHKISRLERQYSRMVENAKDGILSIKTDGSFVFANPAFCSMLGYSLDELRHVNILDTYVEESRQERQERMSRLEGGETVRFERPMKRKDGSRIFVEIGAWKDQYGNLQAFVRDVTERKQAEQALRKSEERFRRFAAASGYGFAMGELSGQLIFANAATLRIVEEEREEDFTRKTFYQYYTPEDAARLRNEILPLVLREDRWEGELPLLSAKGNLVLTEQNIFLIRDEQGMPRMVGNIITDISKRKQMERELAQAKETQFRTLIETLPSKVFLKDRNSTFLACNENYARDLKIKPEEVVGKTDFDFFPTLLAEKHRKDDARVMESGKIESWEEEYQVIGDYLEGSQEAWINTVRAPVRDRSGNVTGLFGFFWDITEQKKIETEKRKILEMKATSEMKSKFTSMVSHELRSPLATIKGALGIVLEGLIGGINEEQRDVLDTAKKNIDRLGRLINNVLDFQKLDAGKMEFDLRENDLNEAVAEVYKSMAVLLVKKSGLEFRLELEEGLPKIKFDRDRVVQVLMNLVNNAIFFTKVGSIVLGVRREAGCVHVSVRDTGPGIKAEDLGRIFQPFEQLESTGGKKKEGTGLGLAISKEIILAHHGKIWAESQEGLGTTFHFTIPL